MTSEVEANKMEMPEELQQRILALKDEKEVSIQVALTVSLTVSNAHQL